MKTNLETQAAILFKQLFFIEKPVVPLVHSNNFSYTFSLFAFCTTVMKP